MTTLKRYEGKDAEDPGKDLAEKALQYMETHPDVDYQTASDIVFKKNPDIAKSYSAGREVEARKEARNAHEEELDASEEMARLTEINMLKFNLGYAEASELTHKENPELFKQYVSRILD